MEYLRERFRQSIMMAIDESCRIGFPPVTIERMLQDRHPVEMAKRLVTAGLFQEGFKNMVRIGRSDITIEAIMLRSEFQRLFAQQ